MKLILSGLLFALLSACSHAPTAEESQLFNQKIETKKSNKSLGSTKDSRIPLKAGQWVTFVTEFKDGSYSKSLSTYKLLKYNGKSLTMEMETSSAKSPDLHIIQYEIENFPNYSKLSMTQKDMEKYIGDVKIKKILMKQGNNPVQEMPVQLMPTSKESVKAMFASGYRISEPKKEACTSTYIKATKCIVFDYETNMMGYISTGKTYTHSEIPLVSFIKTENDKSVTEVINFGNSGAKSSL